MEISAEKLRGPTAATLIGVIGPVMWAMNVPLMRAVVEGFGVAPGECLLYAVATVALFLSVGVPDWRRADRRYLFWGLSSAVACTVCLVLAVYLSTGGAQTMEVGMVNYLWPATTVVAAVLFTGVRATWMLAPGMVLCIASVFWIISGGAFSFAAFFSHAADNPMSYVLALGAALFWTAYSIFTKLWGRGQNFSTVIFAADTLVFGLMWAAGFGGRNVGDRQGRRERFGGRPSSGACLRLLDARDALRQRASAFRGVLLHAGDELRLRRDLDRCLAYAKLLAWDGCAGCGVPYLLAGDGIATGRSSARGQTVALLRTLQRLCALHELLVDQGLED